MAPKIKELPENDIVILGLRTLRSKGMSLEGMAEYYSSILDNSYSRRTIKRRLDLLEGRNAR